MGVMTNQEYDELFWCVEVQRQNARWHRQASNKEAFLVARRRYAVIDSLVLENKTTRPRGAQIRIDLIDKCSRLVDRKRPAGLV